MSRAQVAGYVMIAAAVCAAVLAMTVVDFVRVGPTAAVVVPLASVLLGVRVAYDNRASGQAQSVRRGVTTAVGLAALAGTVASISVLIRPAVAHAIDATMALALLVLMSLLLIIAVALLTTERPERRANVGALSGFMLVQFGLLALRPSDPVSAAGVGMLAIGGCLVVASLIYRKRASSTTAG